MMEADGLFLGAEIVDETDVFVDVDNHIKVAGRTDFDFTKLRRLDAEYVDERLRFAATTPATTSAAATMPPAIELSRIIRITSPADHPLDGLPSSSEFSAFSSASSALAAEYSATYSSRLSAALARSTSRECGVGSYSTSSWPNLARVCRRDFSISA